MARLPPPKVWRIPKGQQFWPIYNAYLLSPEWSAKRAAVMVRSGGKCEKCGRRAEHVHHRSYRHVGQERPWELQALCRACHKAAHSTKS